MSKIVIDRDVFAALASDTRIEILKQLDERRKTLSEMAKNLDCNKSAIHKHLSKLVEAGLVSKEESDHKWIYYSLTHKGKSILHPEKFKLTLLLSSAVVSLAGAIISAYLYLKEKAPEPLKMTAGENSGNGSTGMTFFIAIVLAMLGIALLLSAIFVWKKGKGLDIAGKEGQEEEIATDKIREDDMHQ